MEKQNLRDAVTAIVARQLNRAIEDCRPGADIVQDLGGDALDVLEIGMAIEERFGIDLRDDEFAGGFKTIDDIVGILRDLSRDAA